MPERLRTGGIVLVPALPVVALLIYWGAHEGGYQPTTWMPSALLVLGLLVAAAIGIGFDRMRLSRPALIAAGALAAYTAWSYLSILWADSPGDALQGSDRTLLFLLLFVLFALLPWRLWTAQLTLSLFALGIGVLAIVTLLRLDDAADVVGIFTDGRLTAPVGYVNGAAALFNIGALTAIGLGSRRELPWWARGPLLAGATAALCVAVLCESRGWLFTLPMVALLAVALVPGRVRLALWSLPPLAGTALALPALLDVFSRFDSPPDPAVQRAELIDAAAHALHVALPLIGGVLVVATVLALLDGRAHVPARVSGGANRVAAGLAIVGLIGAVGVGLAATDFRPDQKIADYWDRSSGYQTTDPGASRFGAVGSNRPDFWRVSLKAFRDHPIGGLGQDNWSRFYLLDRRSGEQPKWTHSLELRLLAHTGIVGFLLFAAFLGAVLAAALRGRRPRTVALETSAAAAIAALPLVVWLVHGSLDWFWEFPALSGPAFAFAGLATALMRPAPAPAAAATPAAATPAAVAPADAAGPTGDAPTSVPARDRAARRPLVLALTGAAALAAVVAALALALPWAAERETTSASADWIQDPGKALGQLDRAESLNPLSARASLTEGVIELELGRPQQAEAAFRQAIERDSGDWFAHFGAGLAAAAAGDETAARADYAAAHALNPDDPLVDEALRRVGTSRPLSYTEAFTRLRQDVQNLTGSG
ncbi:O-antigen ligase family protein [Conexibacter sp. JD483]|uniref:tetratricopeptide repeat protein n=1 Tax=unclassified Conexibacter TaxID=2627773 RepID=UPI0027275AF2|nr:MULTISPECIES: tetratricopeptide repeat protein [unclassified Conexibacter]MDO8184250.1 O-antigen ligase family protein [Conexibacter sp. CPCC 205706]MDO8197242.1 O-antigen ligase family protein [Conexibacter sp. CPCC 205762]MDR9367443.1 O-antigen ligase family protein [Conexibacter sp. JD483]